MFLKLCVCFLLLWQVIHKSSKMRVGDRDIRRGEVMLTRGLWCNDILVVSGCLATEPFQKSRILINNTLKLSPPPTEPINTRLSVHI